ncbi:ATP phosphoribosyltransferase regulatory subunit [Spirulina sp. CS-785/01]|uniref:ATP phosphoribosyltransferase regulatory subunit n=1 Tax=Spirulina sp. CS-785/01 TaxID=3021716 RepID=UPI00232D82DA|nr:ATP phosphoribosyltransferase regulatory subunit [Spirulina sp. CS-785/01]MDB9315137.1 ATP phosphoribosyltransferase regulatory subunit [Spirulina sp. CS-785/01]
MIHQPPAGTRDLLPLEVAQKRWIADRLQQVFHRWGYQRIITSTLEWVDTLTAGGAIQPETVIQVEDTAEGRLGLRPELTASIARTAVTRMAGCTYPQRLYYSANVFRRSSQAHHGRQVEFFQTGVELLYSGSSLADTEILLLLADGLQHLGLEQWEIVLGEAGLTRSLLSVFPEAVQETVRYCLANLDRVGLENLDLSPELRDRALLLFDLRGKPEDVLQKVSTLNLNPQETQTVNNLKTLIDRLRNSHSNAFPLILDLSLIETIDYYTGIVFEVVSTRQQQYRVLGKGGRYDHLLELYHPHGESAPGIGFALNIEELHSELSSSEELPQKPPSSHWLVIPTTPQAEIAALHHAQTLRHSDHVVRVELELEGRSPEDIRDYASLSHIEHLVWVDEQGNLDIERTQAEQNLSQDG